MPKLSRLSRTRRMHLKDWEKKKPESGKRPVAMKFKTARDNREQPEEKDEVIALPDLELFYDSLHELKEEYKQYYQEEQTFESLYRNLNIDGEDAIPVLIHLFESYNATMLALTEFDHRFRTNYADDITALTSAYEVPLSAIGIRLHTDGTLLIDQETFKNVHEEKITCFDFLIDAHTGFFKKLYERLHDIKVDRLPSDDTLFAEGLHGAIIDMKC